MGTLDATPWQKAQGDATVSHRARHTPSPVAGRRLTGPPAAPTMRPMRLCRPLALAVALCSVVAPSTVLAAPAGPSRAVQAQVLYDLGVAAFRGRDFVKADRYFQDAFKLDPSPVLLYNLARAAEERGEAKLAIGRYRRYLKDYPNAEDSAQVQQRVRVMDAVLRKAKQGQLKVEQAPPGSRYYIDDQPLAAPGDRGWDLDAGTYRVRVEPPNETAWETEVEVVQGRLNQVEYNAAPNGGGARGLTVAKYATAGVAVAAAITGVVFTTQAISAVDDYNALTDAIRAGGDPVALQRDRLAAKDDRDRAATVSYIMYGVAGVAAAGAVALFLLDADAGDASASAGVQWQVGPGMVGLSGRF